MSSIAGLVYRDAQRPVGRRERETLLASAPLLRSGIRLEAAGAVLLSGGPRANGEALDDALVVADLDVTNLDAQPAATGAHTPAHLLRQLYGRDDTAFPNRLRGAFAIALWMPARRRLILAVDRFGFRRIYYAVGEAGLAFSVRARGALALPGQGSDVEPDAVYAYLNFGTVPAPQSIYRSVRRLPPGHALVWQDGHVAVHRYWDMAYREQSQPRRAAAAALLSHTEEAIRDALSGTETKSTGAFLSGGTDSSTIVGFMSRLTQERVHAFSIGFQEERYNELRYAEIAARHFDAAHYSKLVTADDAFACLPELVEGYDEPFGNNSAIPTYLCARFARETGMQRLLAGDGGDEIFGGNERYRRDRVLARYGWVPGPIRRGIVEPLLKAYPPGRLSLLGKAQRYAQRASLANPDRFYESEFFVMKHRRQLLHPDFQAATNPTWPLDVAREHYQAVATASDLNRLLYIDLKITLGDDDLFKVTRTAELAGVDVRFPMLDHRLVEFTGTLPAHFKVRGAEKRYLFKRAFAGVLPPSILAKTKHGFGLPTSDWLRTHVPFRELARDTLLSTAARQRGYFVPGSVEWLFRLHAADRTPYFGDVIWTLLMLELWHQRHGGPR